MRRSVVILPCQSGKILLQLRDEKPEILYPGCWAFFSGSIETGESPAECTKRELLEEIGYQAGDLFDLGVYQIRDPEDLQIHCFCCRLTTPLEELSLYEGFDFGLFSFGEIRSKQLFSLRAGRFFPVVDLPVVEVILARANEVMQQLMLNDV